MFEFNRGFKIPKPFLDKELRKAFDDQYRKEAEIIEKEIKNLNLSLLDRYRLFIKRKGYTASSKRYEIKGEKLIFSQDPLQIFLEERHRFHYFKALQYWLTVLFICIKRRLK